MIEEERGTIQADRRQLAIPDSEPIQRKHGSEANKVNTAKPMRVSRSMMWDSSWVMRKCYLPPSGTAK